VCLASICAYLGWVLPANTLLLINEDIGPSPNLNWVATAWTLGSGIGFLLVGRLSDIFGRKWMVGFYRHELLVTKLIYLPGSWMPGPWNDWLYCGCNSA
jgi:MFS family permease